MPDPQTLARDDEQARWLAVLLLDEIRSGGAPLRFHKLSSAPRGAI
jgi:hypothetical protein